MLAIRFRRVGRTNVARYRLGVIESSKSAKSPLLEILASYNPVEDDGKKIQNLKKERLDYWMGVGAQVSVAAARLLKKEGILPKDPAPAAKK